jgi:HEAT repeat protein
MPPAFAGTGREWLFPRTARMSGAFCGGRRVNKDAGIRFHGAHRGLSLMIWAALLASGSVACGDADEPESVSQADFMKARGLIRHDGRWMTPQEIFLLQRRSEIGAAERQWAKRLQDLRRDSRDPSRSSVAIETICEIDDPLAVAALSEAVLSEAELRCTRWYLEALARIGTPDAFGVLVTVGLDHADPETRIAAVEQLATERPAIATIGFVAALSGPDNARINRAAEALGRLGDPAAILPLVAVLQTEHVVVDPGSGGAMSVTFTPGQGGLSAGGGPTQRRLSIRNEAVLEALILLTGENFEWRADAWRNWMAAGQSPEGFDPRRD